MKGLYISIFVLGAFFANAQSDLYNKLNSYLTNQTNEVVENRLIAVNLWSVNDKDSRDLNIEFEKAYKVYEYAKLKGGLKGIIFINIGMDVNSTLEIALKKDGVTKSYRIAADNIDIVKEFVGKGLRYNIVFDSNGNKVYENLMPGTVFNSIQQLITR
jgi:hypothetical protein